MPVPSTIDDLSTTAGSNSPSGGETPKDGDNYIRSLSSFIASLRDKLNGTANTGTVKAATFSGTHTFSSGNLLHGTYTPTLTAVANIGTLSATVAQYMRVGNVVTVSGQFIGTPSSVGAAIQVGISLPIASTFSSSSNCGGTGKQSSNANGETLGIYADIFNNRAEAFGQSVGNVGVSYAFHFTYLVA